MTKILFVIAITSILISSVFSFDDAEAVTDCTFTTVGNTMTLDGDCITDSTIFVPDAIVDEGTTKIHANPTP